MKFPSAKYNEKPVHMVILEVPNIKNKMDFVARIAQYAEAEVISPARQSPVKQANLFDES